FMSLASWPTTQHRSTPILREDRQPRGGRVGADRVPLSVGGASYLSLCLVYATLAIRQLAQSMGPELLRDAEQRVLNVGFDSGDFICIGALRRAGLVFSRNSEIME